jgi:hypothetical protein
MDATALSKFILATTDYVSAKERASFPNDVLDAQTFLGFAYSLVSEFELRQFITPRESAVVREHIRLKLL